MTARGSPVGKKIRIAIRNGPGATAPRRFPATSAGRDGPGACSEGLDAATQNELGQFFTPARAAVLIASMPWLPESGEFRVLDPGAGSGMLSAAVVSRLLAERPRLAVHVVAVERDDAVVPYLRETLEACKLASDGRATFEVIENDFIMALTGLGSGPRLAGADLVIQNPPYAKLTVSSAHRAAMRMAGVDAPNLYAAFPALGASALRPRGQLTAITPRSFCNGPYFGAFRSYLLDHIALDPSAGGERAGTAR